MESIIKFSFPSLTYKCSLNLRGRRRYGTLEELLATQKGVISTVGMPDGSREFYTDVRNSVHYTSFVKFDLEKDSVISNLINLNHQAEWFDLMKYDIIEYKTGGFFKEHQDRQLKSTHYGTLLIFPPAVGNFAHTGGELVLDSGKFQFDSSKNMEWTFIAFQTNTFHECKEVLSGRRIVLKTELYSEMPIERDHYPIQYVD
jgi:hypothetical protein